VLTVYTTEEEGEACYLIGAYKEGRGVLVNQLIAAVAIDMCHLRAVYIERSLDCHVPEICTTVSVQHTPEHTKTHPHAQMHTDAHKQTKGPTDGITETVTHLKT
jgi:hypothetical protein